MPLWVCKGGRRGQRESRMLEHSVLGIGWEDLGDLSHIKTRDELKRFYMNTYPDASTGRMRNHVDPVKLFGTPKTPPKNSLKKHAHSRILTQKHKTHLNIS